MSYSRPIEMSDYHLKGYGNDSVQNGPFGVASRNGIFKNRDWLAQAVNKPSVAVSIGGRVEIDQWPSRC